MLNVTGTKLQKNIIVVPINNTLLYVEPIYQVMLNAESQVPLLKKVVVASGNKVAIGNNIEEALKNLLSQEAIDIEIVSEDKDELIKQILDANKNLEQSNISNNWEMIGKDIAKLQELINQLEQIIEQEEVQKKEMSETEDGIWGTNIFGKAVEALVMDGIRNKIVMINKESQEKLQDTMQKIVNDSNGGMVCIII